MFLTVPSLFHSVEAVRTWVRILPGRDRLSWPRSIRTFAHFGDSFARVSDSGFGRSHSFPISRSVLHRFVSPFRGLCLIPDSARSISHTCPIGCASGACRYRLFAESALPRSVGTFGFRAFALSCRDRVRPDSTRECCGSGRHRGAIAFLPAARTFTFFQPFFDLGACVSPRNAPGVRAITWQYPGSELLRPLFYRNYPISFS